VARRLARALIPSPADLVFVGTLLLVLWLGQFISNRDGDLGWHIAIGRLILDTHSIPTQDLFSYTLPGRPFVPHEWLSEVAFAAIYALGGFDGVALMTALVIGATFGGLAAVMLRRGVSPLLVLALSGLGVLTSVAHWATRPHIFTFLFTFLWATALEEHRRGAIGARKLAWLLPLMLLWVNVHGAFIIGDALTATYLAGAALMWLASAGPARPAHRRQVFELLALLALSILVSGLNPSGFGLLGNNAGFFNQDSLLTLTPEWQSPDFHNPLFYPLLLLLAVALVVSVRREVTPLLLLASWAAFSLYSFRNLAQFVIICLPLIGESVQALLGEWATRAEAPEGAAEWLRRLLERLRRLSAGLRAGAAEASGGALSALAVVAVAALLGSGARIDLSKRGYGFSETSFPIAAVQQLKPFPPGQRVFNDAQWGGYLAFCCWPQVRNFFDGRIDFYGADYMRDYQRVQNGELGWREVLDRYQVDWVMVFADRPLVPWLDQDPAWQRIYTDPTTVVFVRRQSAATSFPTR
jgi:hypothetical protein